jgi:hypothetical protein
MIRELLLSLLIVSLCAEIGGISSGDPRWTSRVVRNVLDQPFHQVVLSLCLRVSAVCVARRAC